MSGFDTPLFELLRARLPEEVLLRLIEWRGGRRLYVPREPAALANRGLSAALGPGAAEVLAARFGGEYILVPLAKRWRARLYRGRGLSYGEIAVRLGCSESAVWRHLRAPDAAPPHSRARDERQRDLFR